MSGLLAVLKQQCRKPVRRIPIDVADLFCGAGGSSTGARRAIVKLGGAMNLVCVNHWDTAIATHSKNHPKAKHYCDDVEKVDPLKAVPSGKLDLLMASPSCVTHSRAKGGRPISWDQRKGRMSPRRILYWLQKVKTKAILIENVDEFRDWGPLMRVLDEKGNQVLDKHGKPLWKQNPKKLGQHFKWWIKKLEELGFEVKYETLNAADYGDATTRKRFFLIGRSDGQPIAWPEKTHSKAGGSGLKKWRSAREVIKWELRGRSIFGRERPLAEKTLGRIYNGIVKFKWPFQFVLKLRLYMESLGYKVPVVPNDVTANEPLPLFMRSGMHKSNALCVYDPSDPLRTITTETGGGFGALTGESPDVVFGKFGKLPNATFGFDKLPAPGVVVLRQHADMRDSKDPLPAVAAQGNHFGVAEPAFTFQLNQKRDRARGLKSVDEPMGTLVTRDMKGLVEPFLFANRNENAPKALDDPVPCATTATGGGVAVVEPGALLLNRHGENGSARTRSVEDPVPTATCRGAGYLVEPKGEAFLLPQHYGAQARSTELPTPPPVCVNRTGLVEPAGDPFVLSQGAGGAPRSVEEPSPTAPTRGAHSLIAPYYGASECRPTAEPLGAVTCRGRFGLVMPVTHSDKSTRARSTESPIPAVTCAPRGELAFLTPGFGERKTQAPRVHSIEEPTPTISATGHTPLARGVMPDAETVDDMSVPGVVLADLGTVDILFRMLEPIELAGAMGFCDDEASYEFVWQQDPGHETNR